MINEPKFKKVLIFSVSTMFLVSYIFIVLQNREFSNIHSSLILSYESIVGRLVKEYPDKEDEIVDSLLNTDNEYREYGSTILEKYGYDLEGYMNEVSIFKEFREKYEFDNVVLVAFLCISGIIVIIAVFIYIFKVLNKISKIIDEFIKGNFDYKDNLEDEGIINIIGSQLSQLGRSISFNYSKLEHEKESSKALVTDISHQLKTPLASLSMCNSILEDDSLTKEEREEFLEMSNKNISKLNALIDSLVNISRLEVAMIKLDPKENNLRDTILKAYNSAYVKAKDKGIELIIGEIKDSITLKHDSKWTEEGIFNVLENGIKYTPKGGKVYIDVVESLNYIKIHIKDTGMGISTKEFNDIFKRFYRSKKVDNSDIEGSGVGLYLTRKILEDQGGSIMVKSVEGQGSTFILMLPK